MGKILSRDSVKHRQYNNYFVAAALANHQDEILLNFIHQHTTQNRGIPNIHFMWQFQSNSKYFLLVEMFVTRYAEDLSNFLAFIKRHFVKGRVNLILLPLLTPPTHILFI